MDLRMPEMKGTEAIAELRRIQTNLPILGLTNKEIAQRSFISDMTARTRVASCLVKPGVIDHCRRHTETALT